MNDLVDLQVNGFGGVDFRTPDLIADKIRRVRRDLLARGTGAFLATVVTAPLPAYAHVLPLLAEAARETLPDGAELLGVHLEGPFISPEEGYVGAHPAEHVLDPSADRFDELQSLADGTVKLLTLAPERPGAAELIAHASAQGVLVAIGHTHCGAAHVAEAVDAGARLSTHLGNGIPRRIDRHENPLWPQLAEPRLKAMLVADGHHLPPAFLRTVFHVKGSGGIILTSDAAPIAGCPPGRYESFGAAVDLEPSGRISLAGTGLLAGSSACLKGCVEYMQNLNCADPAALCCMGRDNALELLGLASV